MGSLVRATALWGYVDLVHELGGRPETFLERFEIPFGVEKQDDAFISLGAALRLLDASASELGCPDFGLRLIRWQGLGILGPVAVIARNAETVEDGMGAIARYLYVHSPGLKLMVEPHGSGTDLRFVYEMVEPNIPDMRQGYEVSMANAAQMVRLLSGGDAGPGEIAFMHDQLGPDSSYDEALGCPVSFGQSWCGFVLPAALAGRPIDSADPETRRIATKYLEANYLPTTASMAERVAELARRLLPTGHCTAEAIADQLGMHERTLRRYLTAEGIGCQDVIDSERRAQAARYLAEPRLQLSQIASLLGYAEQSTLNRSCRRWFGMTPRQYRGTLTP